MAVKLNTKAPDFVLPAQGGKKDTVSLKDFKDKAIILYFYPKDNTSGCTAQACDFRDDYRKFTRSGAVVIGVSKDSLKSHEKFSDKYELPFILASDEDGKICKAYGTWVKKSMYGRSYMGIERATFLINDKGKIKQIWRKVKVKDHVAEVLAAVKAL